MPAATSKAPAPRFGSAAELTAYSGLSVKTVRRLVVAGKVRGRKVGRRLLIPFEDMDRLILPIDDHRRPPMPGPTTAPPPSAVDARGRAVPRTAEEQRRRAEDALRMLDALDDIGDEEEQRQTFDALRRGLDAARTSERRRFRG